PVRVTFGAGWIARVWVQQLLFRNSIETTYLGTRSYRATTVVRKTRPKGVSHSGGDPETMTRCVVPHARVVGLTDIARNMPVRMMRIELVVMIWSVRVEDVRRQSQVLQVFVDRLEHRLKQVGRCKGSAVRRVSEPGQAAEPLLCRFVEKAQITAI